MPGWLTAPRIDPADPCGMSVRAMGWFFAVVVACSAAGCVFDDPSCGPHMRYATDLGVCVCEDNAVADGGACTPCEADEVVLAAACVCPAGEAKTTDGLCAPVPGLGSPCDASSPCSSPTYSYCSTREGVGQCTSRCASDADCPASYTCADWEAEPSCRTFTGYGASCVDSTGCASFDADFCVQGRCVVHGCTLGTDDCPRDTQCCDFSTYGLGTICVPAESCS